MEFNRDTRRLLTRLQKADGPQVTDITESVHILAQAGLVEYEAYQAWPNMVLAWAVPLIGEVNTKPAYLVEMNENLRYNENLASARIKELEQLAAQKDQENSTLRAELNRVHDEYTWLASRKGIEHTVDAKTLKFFNRLQKRKRPSPAQLTPGVQELIRKGYVDWKPTRNIGIVMVWALPVENTKHQTKQKEQTMVKVSIDVQNVTLGGNIVVGSAIISVEVPDDALAIMTAICERCLPTIFGNATHDHTCKCEASNGDKRPGTAATYHGRGKERGTPTEANAFAPMDVD